MAQGHPLSDADREYRRVLGLRIAKAAGLAGLSYPQLAQLISENVTNIYQFVKGVRNVQPAVLDRIAQATGISVEDLLADEDAPMASQGAGGRCPAGYVVEMTGGRFRAAVLLVCSKPSHDDTASHHDPRGLDWRSAPGI